MRKSLLIVTAIVLVAGAASATNDMAVTPAAALQGTSNGLEITLDGSSADLAYLQDDSPNGETVYRAAFRLDRNTLDSYPNGHTVLFRANPAVGKAVLVRLAESKFVDTIYYVYSFSNNDSNVWTASNPGMQFKAGVDTGCMIEWQASSGANDGFLRMYKDAGLGYALKATISNIDNDTKVIDYARLGLSGAPAATSGTMYFDEFESYRTLAP